MAKLPPAGYVPDVKPRRAKSQPAMHHAFKKKTAKKAVKKAQYVPITETMRNRFQK